jgi:hypothetical protein
MKNSIETIINDSNNIKHIFKCNGIELSDDCLVRVYSNSMTIELTSDKFTQRVFGSTVTVYANKHFGSEERTVELNVGSLGSFTPDCASSMFIIKTQFNIVSQWKSFTEVVVALTDEVEVKNELARLISKKN